jgi:hypothetical protein
MRLNHWVENEQPQVPSKARDRMTWWGGRPAEMIDVGLDIIYHLLLGEEKEQKK